MHTYSPREERWNIATHFAGFVLGLVGCFFLVLKASLTGTAWHIVSFSIFGASLVTLFAASTLYHRATCSRQRACLRTFDHAAIYLLIAGTYTPFTLVTLQGATGWWIFGVVWGMAATGITLKLFYTGRYDLVSTLMYVFMGWLILFAIGPLIDAFAGAGLFWLVAGGIAYTVGAVFYSIPRMPYGHATFHLFVLIGSGCHFAAIYGYV